MILAYEVSQDGKASFICRNRHQAIGVVTNLNREYDRAYDFNVVTIETNDELDEPLTMEEKDAKTQSPRVTL